MDPKLFPTLLIVLMVAAALVYGLHKDWHKMTYYLAGAVINASVVY